MHGRGGHVPADVFLTLGEGRASFISFNRGNEQFGMRIPARRSELIAKSVSWVQERTGEFCVRFAFALKRDRRGKVSSACLPSIRAAASLHVSVAFRNAHESIGQTCGGEVRHDMTFTRRKFDDVEAQEPAILYGP